MRNLKRALSLVLASAMLIGMMVFGASAAGYKDSDTVNNDTAVEVLSALGIVGGDENGNFRPASTLTRAEFCVMIANVLTGGTFDKALFEGTATPFTDIQGHWGAPFIAFCYSSGVIAGTTATTFSPDATLTSAQAEAILLSALGYNENGEFAANDQFELNVTSWAQRVGLMDNLTVAANAAITRDNTAQLMFNTLTKAVPVEYNDSFGVYYNALGRGTDWFAGVQFRFNETLGYTNFDLVYDSASEDDFYRLGTEWATGNLPHGTGDLDDNGNIKPGAAYIRDSITVQLNTPELSYTTKVSEREIYRALSLKKDTNELPQYLDGMYKGTPTISDDKDKNLQYSGTGVLTEVYKEGESYRIVFIDTFLAQATTDYNTKNDQVTLKVYKYDKNTRTVAADTMEATLAVKGEDVAAAMNLVQNDFVLVNIADGEIKIIDNPETIASATVTAFSKNKYVVTGGETYNYAVALQYDEETLKYYDNPNLKDVTYTLYLDPYGYLIGINQDEEANQYLFITGVDVYSSHFDSARATANAIFLDGTMATIDIKYDTDDIHLSHADGDAVLNTWFTYSVNDAGVYTVKEVERQAWSYYSLHDGKINSNNPGLSAVEGYDWDTQKTFNRVTGGQSVDFVRNKVAYGNDDSVFITAGTKGIKTDYDSSTGDPITYGVISSVESVVTGIKNVNITVKNVQDKSDAEHNLMLYSNGVYTLYDKNGYVIAAVIVGEDEGNKNDHVFYALSGVKLEEYADGSWTWSIDGVLDGKEATIYKRGDTKGALSMTDDQKLKTGMKSWEDFKANYAYQISEDADGYVNDIDKLVPLDNGFPNLSYDIASKNIQVLLHRTYYNYDIHMEGWTLYLTENETNGVAVANDCPTALVELNADGDYVATYFDDAQSAIRAMENRSVVTGKIVASVNKDRIITSLVVVVEEYANAGTTGSTTPATPDFDVYNLRWSATAPGELTFTVKSNRPVGTSDRFTWTITGFNAISGVTTTTQGSGVVEGGETLPVGTGILPGSGLMQYTLTVTINGISYTFPPVTG